MEHHRSIDFKEVGKIKNSLMQDLIDVNIIRGKGDETLELVEDFRKVAKDAFRRFSSLLEDQQLINPENI